MKVADCEKCKNYERRRWVTSFKPANYHTIGVAHAYAYCKKYNNRCLKIKNCKELKA